MLRLANRIFIGPCLAQKDQRMLENATRCFEAAGENLREGAPVIIADELLPVLFDTAWTSDGNMPAEEAIPPFANFWVEAVTAKIDPHFADTAWHVSARQNLGRAILPDFSEEAWLSEIVTFARPFKTPKVCLQGFTTLLAEEPGVSCFECVFDEQIVDPLGEMAEAFRWMASQYASFISLVYRYLACSNTKLVDAPEYSPTPKWCRRTKQPMLRYRTITIDGSKSRRRSTETGTGPKKGLHLARAHMRIYRPEDGKGLFGREQYGTFLIPAHARGDAKRGIVKSTYNVKAPRETN